ncbi:MAG: amino acid adenylation domain-containing protein, partial [Acidobacteriota bacterium]
MLGTLHEAVDPSRLEEAWQRVVARHPGLRTVIRSEDVPEPVQEVRGGVEVGLKFEDWSDRPEASREALLEQWLQSDRLRGFDLDRPPLLRVTLFRFSECEFRLVLTYHRMLLDAISVATVIHEVLDDRVGDRTPGDASAVLFCRSPPPDRTPDVAAEQAYWRSHLRGVFGTPTSLGIDQTPETIPGTPRAWGEHAITLSADVGRCLGNLAAKNGASLETLFRGAWALLLHRYNGEPDVVFGVRSPTGGGSPKEPSREPVGNRTNTLPLRIRIDESGSVEQWIRKMGIDEASVRPFEGTSLPRIRRWSEVEAGTPLFQSLLVLEGPSLNARLRSLGDSWLTREFRVLARSGCPVTIHCHPESEPALRIVYEKGRIDDSASARMLGHFARLLRGIAEAPESPVGALPLLSDAELEQLESWNDTRAEVPQVRVTDLIEAQVARTPDRIAIAYGGSAWTFRELDRRSNRIARYLQRQGLCPGARVGLLMEPSLEMVAGLLGILKGGAAYVPLDPELPEQRLEFMMRDARLALLVTQQRLRTILRPRWPTPVFLDSVWQSIEAEDDQSLPWPGTADPDAYVIYTSGSTGQPKGVCVPHSALVNLLRAMRERPGLGEADVLLGIATISFDIAGLELFLPLITGARLDLLDRRIATDARALAESIAEIQPTVMQATPSLWRMLLESGWEGDPNLKIICGGEALSRDLANRLLARCGSVWNGYGPTETTIYSTMHRVENGTGPVPIGRPIANTRIYVLDSKLRALPQGVAGELVIGGAGVARGYLGRPDLTAEKFIPNPLAGGEGRLYRTGDLARHVAEGSLEYLGRTDDQVKIRGFRVELGEIEFALSRHPSVRQSVVLARHDGRIARRLVAYVVVDRSRKL